MKKISFIRHAQGVHNLSEQNWQIEHPDLTDLGKSQCKKLSNSIDKEFDIIYVSPLKRTLKTAELVFGKENNFIATELIKEAIVNPCDKRESKVESIKNFPFINFTNINDNYDYNKIESNSKIENRCDEFYNLIKNSHHKNIAVVTHGEYLNRFINKYSNQLNIQDKNWFKNCELRTGFIY